MFDFCEFSESVHVNSKVDREAVILICDGRINFEFDIKCVYDIETDEEKMKVQYSLIAENDEYRLFGISAKLIDAAGQVVSEEKVRNKYATLSEVIRTMRMLAKETVLPFTVEDVLI